MTDRTTALDSVKELFDTEVQNATYISMMEVHEEIQAIAKLRLGTQKKRQDTNRKFEKGFQEWIEAVGNISRNCVKTVALVANTNPERDAKDASAWARKFVKQLIDQWWNSAPTENFPGWLKTWIMEVCDGGIDLDRYEFGRPKQWCAPVWTLRLLRDKNISDRLSLEQTETLIRLKQSFTETLFENALTTGEHEARVTLATQPTLSRVENVVSSDEANLDLPHAADFSYVDYGGKRHYLTKNQRIVVRALHVCRQRGQLCVPKKILSRELGGDIKDSFKQSSLWRTLVVPNRSPKGTYSLNLAPPSATGSS